MPEPTKPAKRTLLQKYEIPIQNLDFEYVRACTDGREVERIYQILQSGQEGHYPDLALCTADRLRQLRPNSRALRVETPLLQPGCAEMPEAEWQALNGDLQVHLKTLQKRDEQLRSVETAFGCDLPPIRSGSATVDAGTDSTNKADPSIDQSKRIKSCDYEQWDKYDADTELTKMDLSAEQARESEALRDKRKVRPIERIVSEAAATLTAGAGAQLTAIERDECAESCRIQGNEHYRVGDFTDAIAEYTRSLSVKRTALAFGNRAMAYLKLNENQKAIEDCDECLALDGANLKALLRKAQALLNEDRPREAFAVYALAKRVDPSHQAVLSALQKLRARFPDLPPENARRILVQETSAGSDPRPVDPKQSQKSLDEDFAASIRPTKIVPSKMARMAQTMRGAGAMKPKPTNEDQPAEIRTRQIERAATDSIRMHVPTQRTEYRNGVIIEELN